MLVLQSVRGYKLFYCGTNDAGRRLDRVVKKMLPDVPAGLIYSGIRKGRIRVNGGKTTQSYLIRENDEINISESIVSSDQSVSAGEKNGNTGLLGDLIISRTEDLCFINKPAGMLTHGQSSLAELVKNGLPGIETSLSFTPAPLHRLDRNTSGLIAVSCSIRGASDFSAWMRERKIQKYYLGLCIGTLSEELVLEDRLTRRENQTRTGNSGKMARTLVSPAVSAGGMTLCLIKIETGITHQIRSQLSSAGYPLAGDIKYGGGMKGFRRFILHSWAMILPGTDEIADGAVFAEIPENSRQKLGHIFGSDALEASVDCIRRKIIN